MKKSTFTFALLATITLFGLNKASGQWATSGNNIYNTNTGSVGIGNNAPSTLLYVAKSMTEPTITVRNLGGGGGATYTMMDDVSGANWKFKATNSGGFKIRDHANLMDVITIEPGSAANSIYIKTGGNIGMGINTPDAKLHINSNARGVIVDGTGSISSIPFQGLGFQYFGGSGEGSIQASFPGGFGFMTFHTTNNGTIAEWMRITYEGNVGVGTTAPNGRLHVVNPAWSVETTGIFDNADTNSGSNGLYVNTAITNSTANVLNAAAGGSSRLYVRADGNVGINNASPNGKLDISHNANSFIQLGYTTVTTNNFFHREDPADGDGQSAVFGYRTRTSQNDGGSYVWNSTNTAVKGYNHWGDLYTFGVTGHSYNDFNRCGGVLGSHIFSDYWGSLGYKNSGNTSYGGYFTSSTIGTGKSVSTAMIGIGMGAWGDLMGADIHGKIYGTFTEGEHYAMYAKGDVYKDKLDIHLQENGSETRTVLYTSTSTEVTVQTSGKATLTGGKAVISFDPAFAASLLSEESLVITVTPIGESNGVHLAQVTKSGFTVAENNDGKSSVVVNYIAIGKRAGYENPSLASEVISSDYTGKISRGLRTDANTQIDSEGLYFEGGKLTVGVHPSTLPDTNKPAEEKPIIPETSAPMPTFKGADPASMINKTN